MLASGDAAGAPLWPAALKPAFFIEQFGQLIHHRAAELFGIDDGDRAPIVARHVMADADGKELDR